VQVVCTDSELCAHIRQSLILRLQPSALGRSLMQPASITYKVKPFHDLNKATFTDRPEIALEICTSQHCCRWAALS
jgi:hypothetical protein